MCLIDARARVAYAIYRGAYDTNPPHQETLADAHAAVAFGELKIDLPTRSGGASAVARPAAAASTGKKRISLADYRRRKAAGGS